MKKILKIIGVIFVILFLLITIRIFSFSKIDGIVTDNNGNPVKGAIVSANYYCKASSLVDNATTLPIDFAYTISDENGNYHIPAFRKVMFNPLAFGHCTKNIVVRVLNEECKENQDLCLVEGRQREEYLAKEAKGAYKEYVNKYWYKPTIEEKRFVTYYDFYDVLGSISLSADNSKADFKVNPNDYYSEIKEGPVTLLSPVGGEVWKQGASQKIIYTGPTRTKLLRGKLSEERDVVYDVRFISNNKIIKQETIGTGQRTVFNGRPALEYTWKGALPTGEYYIEIERAYGQYTAVKDRTVKPITIVE
jgi:hypothetical protein